MKAIGSIRAVLALAAVLAAVAAALLPAAAPARTSRPHGAGCTARHRTAAQRRAAAKGCAKHTARSRKPKPAARRRPRPAAPQPPKPRLVPAECEDGSTPSAEGSFACEDGSRPVCEDGSAPTATGAGGMPMCAIAPEEGEACAQESAGAEECPLVEWACAEQREGSAAPAPCEEDSAEALAGEPRRDA